MTAVLAASPVVATAYVAVGRWAEGVEGVWVDGVVGDTKWDVVSILSASEVKANEKIKAVAKNFIR